MELTEDSDFKKIIHGTIAIDQEFLLTFLGIFKVV